MCVCVCVCVYICHFCTCPWCFCVSSVVNPISNLTTRNPLIYQPLPILSKEMELFTALNSFVGADKNDNLPEFSFYSNSMARKLPIPKCMGKFAVQLKSHRESEIAQNLSEIPW